MSDLGTNWYLCPHEWVTLDQGWSDASFYVCIRCRNVIPATNPVEAKAAPMACDCGGARARTTHSIWCSMVKP